MASATGLSGLLVSSLLLSCLFLIFPAVDAATDAEGALNDVKALIELKRSITSNPLSILANWDDATAPNACNWTGISCSSNKKHLGRVVQISLSNATMRGSLSPHVANISFLQVLDIPNNYFSGRIPLSLGKLGRLRVLNLCFNEFQGPIPRTIGNLSSLQFLFLCVNSLTGEIPQSLFSLKALQKLNLGENQLTGQIPSWLGLLPRLELLELSENKMHGLIPVQLGNLSFVKRLSISQNFLTGSIPCSFGRLCHLKQILFHGNHLTATIPHCLSNLTAISVLDFSANSLQGHLPAWVGSLHQLQSLELFSNNFSGEIPELWGNLTQIQYLELGENRLVGPLPSWFRKMCSQLYWLHLGSNYFTSAVSNSRQPIPFLKALSNCSRLSFLSLHDNLLTGTLPPNLGSFWPNLQQLDLPSNFISGKIPESMQNLSSVFSLNLRVNMFSGTIPPQIANMKSVQDLDLGANKLGGNIPAKISLLNNSLQYLYLSTNSLSGSVPLSIGELVNLHELHLDGNLLSGKIPNEIANCHVLESLKLSKNNLSGAIPPEVAGLKNIIFYFDLSGNRLSGEVPPEIAGLQMAQFINLSSNHLSGKVALYIDSWLDARQINLSLNEFTGNLSNSIGNRLTQLQRIDLSGNNFTGPVPASLLNFSYLRFVNFSYNNFDGEVACLNSSSKFPRLSRWSFYANPNLCGTCFGLRACQRYQSKENDQNSILKIVLGTLSGLLFLVVTGHFILLRKKEEGKRVEKEREQFLKLCVEKIKKATDNFSASNLVGEGTHGKVYRGILGADTIVAIKSFSCTNQSMAVKSFRKECHALAKVRHRNILKIITVVSSYEFKAIVMPFMNNGSLYSLLHSRDNGQLSSLKLPMRVKILTELASGLSYLHHDCHSQIIHCDIKPRNVLLNDDITVKLSDFGISHIMGDADCLATSSSSVCLRGSVGYIAPEYGNGERPSVKGDVYSFGVVALEVMTRLKPTHEMFSEILLYHCGFPRRCKANQVKKEDKC